jgi:fatty-acyl-CoA synthase
VLYGIEGVSEVAVIGLPDPKWIEAVTAIVVAKAGYALTEAGIIAAASAKLAHFKVPKRVHLTDALPKNPSGKLLKRELRRQYEAAAGE